MRLHYLQHVPFEGLANIAAWAANRLYTVTGTRLYDRQSLPSLDAFDMLVVLGGPMNVDQHDEYPWLLEERQLIGQAIDRGKVVLGICLGAQLLARVLGAQVGPNRYKEIGWFPVSLSKEGRESRFFAGVPDEFVAFHWHGDTFGIPPGASRLAESRVCANQAFQYGDRVLALQFHLEYTQDSLAAMIAHCGEELVAGPTIQRAEEIVAGGEHVRQTQSWLAWILDGLAQTVVNA